MPMGYKPNPGFKWNPMRKYPRNCECPCGSKKKFKRCCLPKMAEVCAEKDFQVLDKFVTEALAQYDAGKLR